MSGHKKGQFGKGERLDTHLALNIQVNKERGKLKCLEGEFVRWEKVRHSFASVDPRELPWVCGTADLLLIPLGILVLVVFVLLCGLSGCDGGDGYRM